MTKLPIRMGLRWFTWPVLLGGWLLSLPSLAQDNKTSGLVITPSQCVALHRGQTCYQTVTVEWQAGASQNVCLVSSQGFGPLRCWENVSQGKVTLEVETMENVEYALVNQANGEQLASIVLRVSWVYKQKRKKVASWRLF